MDDDYELALIVEGQGDERAVHKLVRRLCIELELGIPEMNENDVIRVHRDKLIRDFETNIELAARKVDNRHGRILVVFDADDDCPAELGPELQSRARDTRPDIPIGIALPKYEFENWFIAGCSGFLQQPPPPRPESIRDAKGWMQQRREYRPTRHQDDVAWNFDLEQALGRHGTSGSRSLVKLRDELDRILCSVD